MEKLAGCKQTLEKIQPGCTLPRSRKKKGNNSTLSSGENFLPGLFLYGPQSGIFAMGKEGMSLIDKLPHFAIISPEIRSPIPCSEGRHGKETSKDLVFGVYNYALTNTDQYCREINAAVSK
jgi:hypothetical protein